MSKLSQFTGKYERPEWPFSILTAATTLQPGDERALNTTSAAFTVTLPASPAAGARVALFDAFGTWGEKPPTVARNGQRIMGLLENMVLDVQYLSLELVFVNSARGWVIV